MDFVNKARLSSCDDVARSDDGLVAESDGDVAVFAMMTKAMKWSIDKVMFEELHCFGSINLETPHSYCASCRTC